MFIRDGLVLVSQEGEAWTGSWPAPQPAAAAQRRAVSPPSAPKGPKETAPVSIKLKRLSHAHRAVSAACDSKGKNSSSTVGNFLSNLETGSALFLGEDPDSVATKSHRKAEQIKQSANFEKLNALRTEG